MLPMGKVLLDAADNIDWNACRLRSIRLRSSGLGTADLRAFAKIWTECRIVLATYKLAVDRLAVHRQGLRTAQAKISTLQKSRACSGSSIKYFSLSVSSLDNNSI